MTTQATGRQFTYLANAKNEIVSVCREWLAFAAENGAESLIEKGVVGKPLREFITDRDTLQIYEILLDRVRRSGKSVKVAYRCDSPAVRRFMELDLTPLEASAVRFVSRIVREEPREAVALLDPDRPHSSDFVTMCSWCKTVDTGPSWLEVEAAIAELDLFNRDEMPQVTHGMCPDCFVRLSGV